MHDLIRVATENFQIAEVGDDGLYLKPRKKLLVDITTSRKGLDHCLKFANDLFIALERRGHRVAIAPSFELLRIPIETQKEPEILPNVRVWAPLHPTVVHVHGTPIGLAVTEISEAVTKHYVGDGKFISEAEFANGKYYGLTWTRKMFVPCGRIRLTAYSPLHRFPCRQEWAENPNSSLGKQLESIVVELEDMARALLACIVRSSSAPGDR